MNTAPRHERDVKVVPTRISQFEEFDFPIAPVINHTGTVFMGGRDNGPAMTNL